jgi:hypothetical protein
MNHEKVLSAILAKKKTTAVVGTPPSFAGVWKNEYQSTASFTINGSAVTGTYTSQVSGGGGSVTGPISGQVSGDTIAFTVLWQTTPPSIIAWIGQIVVDPASGVETLETLWHLIGDISEDPNRVWKSVYAGADNFTRGP